MTATLAVAAPDATTAPSPLPTPADVIVMAPRVPPPAPGRSPDAPRHKYLSGLAPADDEHADLDAVRKLPALGLTAADIADIEAARARLDEATAKRVEADQAVGAARHAAALKVPDAVRSEEAAAAFKAGEVYTPTTPADEAAAIEAKARTAARALPALIEDAARARDAEILARGTLRAVTVRCLTGARTRAAERYRRIAVELSEALAAVVAANELIPSADAFHDGLDVALARFAVPACGYELDKRGVTELSFVDMLAAREHPRFGSQLAAQSSDLKQTITEHAGTPAATLLAPIAR